MTLPLHGEQFLSNERDIRGAEDYTRAGTKPGFEPGGPKHEPKKFQVTWFIKKKKKNHGRQNNCILLP